MTLENTMLIYKDNVSSLKEIYARNGLMSYFEKDNAYLGDAFENIQHLWIENFNRIKTVKYIMIGEAPLWGEKKKYIYNPETKNSQFFYRSDLECVLNSNESILDKSDFLECCNRLGLLIIDISPFALNPKHTKIDYKQLSRTSQYANLVKQTIPGYFTKKLELIKSKKAKNMKIFFRYCRVKDSFQEIIAPVLIKEGLIRENDIPHVSQSGGGIDRMKLKAILR
jgi:hypothetical protein